MVAWIIVGSVLVVVSWFFLGYWLEMYQLRQAWRPPTLGESLGFEKRRESVASRIWDAFMGERPWSLNVPTGALEPNTGPLVLGAAALVGGVACFFVAHWLAGVIALGASLAGAWLASLLWIVYAAVYNLAARERARRQHERQQLEAPVDDMSPDLLNEGSDED